MKSQIAEMLVTPQNKFNTYKERIARSIQSKSIAFILGGGVSVDYNIPQWNKLLARLLSLYLENNNSNNGLGRKNFNKNASRFIEEKNVNLTVLARFLKKELGNNNNWKSRVKDTLYEMYDNEDLVLKETTLRYLANFSIRNKNTVLLTYNFDSIFEELLEKCNAKVLDYKSSYEPKGRINPEKINVYHLHGYLPSPFSPKRYSSVSRNIILCEDDYHYTAINPVSWTNTIPLSVLLTRTCIFVGTSLTDVNQRRLLDIYKAAVETSSEEPNTKIPGLRYHYALLRHPLYEKNHKQTGSTNSTSLPLYAKMQEKILKDLLVLPIWYKDHKDLRLILKYLLNDSQMDLDKIHVLLDKKKSSTKKKTLTKNIEDRGGLFASE